MGSEINVSFLPGGSSNKTSSGSQGTAEIRSRTTHKAEEIFQTLNQDVRPNADHSEFVPIVELDEVAKKLNEYAQSVHRELDFRVEEGNTIITVRDSRTHEIIREIPPKELRELAQKLQEGKVGLFKDHA